MLGDDVVSDSAISLRRWLVPTLLCSVLLHFALVYLFGNRLVTSVSTGEAPRLVPRAFKVNRLQVNQQLVDQDAKMSPTPGAQFNQPGTPKGTQKGENSFEEAIQELRATPEVNSMIAPDFKEKPSVDTQTARNAAAKAKNENAIAIDKELSQFRQQLLNEKPAVSSRPRIAVGNRNNPGKSNNEESEQGIDANNAGVPAGFSNLDELLTGSGKVGNGTAPILMPTDLLFDYDSANLRPGATASLLKLGRLIQRNPQSNFRVEGHTDSFGSDDYNQLLSQQRAESVKTWLVDNMNIDPTRIQTQGFGKTRLIASANGSVEEQQLNRRVEIVIHSK